MYFNYMATKKTSSKTVPFAKNPVAILFVAINGLVALVTVGLVVYRLRSSDFKVPGQYIANGGDVELTQWYSLYSLAIFALFSFFISVFIARKLYLKTEIFAWGVLICQLVLGVTGLFISNALLGLVSRL